MRPISGHVPQVAFRIQAHPSRANLVDQLVKQLPSPEVVWDTTGPWEGYQACLADTLPRVTHLCVIQDDATLCQNFVPRVLEAVAEKPKDLISLFVGGIRNRNSDQFRAALERGERWSPLISRNSIDIIHCVALVWPVDLVSQFREWAKTTKIHNPNSDDAYLSAWIRNTNRIAWATVPSLVEHRDLVPSTIGRPHQGGRNKKRIGIAFADDT